MKTVLFIDTICPKPYDKDTLETQAMGGTEASVVRVAEGLTHTGLFNVAVEQHNRLSNELSTGTQYISLGSLPKADYVICLRNPEALHSARSRFPNSKIYLWSHDLAGPGLAKYLPTLEKLSDAVISVSEFHRTQIIEALRPNGYTGQFPIKAIYNPIPDHLEPDSTLVNPNKLFWLSSPHKGLEYAIQLFSAILRFNPDFILHVANPGYMEDFKGFEGRVVNAGQLCPADVIRNLRDSLAVFYPNVVFPETFGLVYAEANAVGTPVLAHNFGSAYEILDGNSQTLDCHNIKQVVDRVLHWHNGNRPTVRCKPQFRLSRVIRKWMNQILHD